MLQNDFSALIVGAGSAGHACAAELRRLAPDARITVIDDEPGGPINRMLVTKGVLTGLLGPELIAQPPIAGVERVAGRAVALLRSDEKRGGRMAGSGVRLADGTELFADAVVVATGSRSRPLGAEVEVDPAVRLYALQTAADAVALRDAVTAVAGDLTAARAAVGAAPRLIVIGAGFIGTEVADHFIGAGIAVTVIGRGDLPLQGAFGEKIAARLGSLHRERGAILDKTVRAVRAQGSGVLVELNDGSNVVGDAVAVAVGVTPESGWAGLDGGLPVDGRSRVVGSGQGLYAAGGVAVHSLGGGKVVIDHWDAAAEQGTHAARAILFDLEIAADPGDYLPKSGFTLRAFGNNFAGYGFKPAQGNERAAVRGESGDATLTEFVDDHGVLTGVAGLDAATELRARLERLGAKSQGV